jgi:hypothetical protein
MYAVVQISLERSISRDVLESAIMATQQLAKPDCARLVRESFGIVAGSLLQADALALQAALRARGIETEVVNEADLPSLPVPHHPQSVDVAEDGVTFTDYTGQATLYPMSVFVYAAGGYVKHLAAPQRKLELVQRFVPRQGMMTNLEMVTERNAKEVVEFRIEYYFTQEPFRFQCVLDDKAIVRVNGQVLKLRDHTQLNSLLLTFANAFPADQTNLGIRKIVTGQEFIYPSVHAFEEEIIWSLYRMTHKLS